MRHTFPLHAVSAGWLEPTDKDQLSRRKVSLRITATPSDLLADTTVIKAIRGC